MLLISLIYSEVLSSDRLQSPAIVDVSFASLACYQLSDFDYVRAFLLSYLMHLSNRPLLSPMLGFSHTNKIQMRMPERGPMLENCYTPSYQ